MPCPEHDALSKELFQAMHAHDRYRDSVTAHLSAKNRAEGRAREASNLRSKQYTLNSHIEKCDACKAEGRKPNPDDLAGNHHF
jgi:hypothetical protein